MDQRGRKSSAEVTTLRPAVPGERLPAPTELTPEQAQIWRDVTETKPAEWFQPDTAPILIEYCQLITLSRETVQQLKAAEGKDWRELVKIKESLAKSIASLGTKMRLTQQSRYTPQASSTANKKANTKRPWEN